MLRESLGDFEHVKGALGHDTVETIVQDGETARTGA